MLKSKKELLESCLRWKNRAVPVFEAETVVEEDKVINYKYVDDDEAVGLITEEEADGVLLDISRAQNI